MVAANQADFLGESGGSGNAFTAFNGLSDLSRAQIAQKEANAVAERAASVQAAADLKKRLDESNAAKAKAITAQQNAAWDAAQARSGGLLGDLKVIGSGVASAAGTVAKVAGTVAAVVPGGQIIGGVLVAGGAALTAASKGDVKGVVVGAVTAAAPAAGGAVSSVAKVAAPVVDAAKQAAAVLKSTAPLVQTIAASGVVDTLSKGANVAASSLVPALGASLVNDAKNVEGLKVIADKLLAARDLGGALGTQAQQIMSATAKLASPLTAGVPADVRASAAAAMAVVSKVNVDRKNLGIAAGVEQAVTAAGAKAAAQYISGTLGMQVALAPGVTVRSEQPTTAFAAVPVATRAVVTAPAPASALIAGFSGAAPAAAPAPAPKTLAELVAATAPTTRAVTNQLSAATSSQPAAVAKPATSSPAPAPAPAPAPTPAPEVGFVVTADGRVLSGTSWLENDKGTDGTLVRASGPVALRVDGATRRWKAA